MFSGARNELFFLEKLNRKYSYINYIIRRDFCFSTWTEKLAKPWHHRGEHPEKQNQW